MQRCSRNSALSRRVTRTTLAASRYSASDMASTSSRWPPARPLRALTSSATAVRNSLRPMPSSAGYSRRVFSVFAQSSAKEKSGSSAEKTAVSSSKTSICRPAEFAWAKIEPMPVDSVPRSRRIIGME